MLRCDAFRGCLAMALAAVTVAVVPVVAHHSFAAEFSEEKPITVKGTLTGIKLVNPHGWLYMDITDDEANGRLVPPVKGKTVNWAIETVGVNTLYRSGWRPADLPVGETITVQGYMARDGSPAVTGVCVTLANGRRLAAAGGVSETSGSCGRD